MGGPGDAVKPCRAAVVRGGQTDDYAAFGRHGG
jgi:hypothetical protein